MYFEFLERFHTAKHELCGSVIFSCMQLTWFRSVIKKTVHACQKYYGKYITDVDILSHPPRFVELPLVFKKYSRNHDLRFPLIT